MRNVFGSDKTIDGVPSETFVEHLASFFRREGVRLLSGDKNEFERLVQYSHKKNKAYSLEMQKLSYKSHADHYWERRDYASFLKYVDLLSLEILPKSYELKVQIAQEKIRKR